MIVTSEVVLLQAESEHAGREFVLSSLLLFKNITQLDVALKIPITFTFTGCSTSSGATEMGEKEQTILHQ